MKTNIVRNLVAVWAILAFLVSLGGIYALYRANQSQAESLVRRDAEIARLKLPVAPSGRSPVILPPASPPAATEETRRARSHSGFTKDAEEESIHAQVRRDLAAAAEKIAQLQVRVNQLQAQMGDALAENKRVSAALTASSEQAAESARTMESLKGEVKQWKDQVGQLETANTRLQVANTGSVKKNEKGLADLQEISRRREAYLSNLLRRYKEVTDIYRRMVAVSNSQRDRDSGPIADSELGRIQTAISAAEDDLRQVTALNTEALRIQKRVFGN